LDAIRLGFLSILLSFSVATGAAQSETGRRVYSRAAESVLEIFTVSNGKLTGQGSGFLIEGGAIVTNAHVVSDGDIYLKIGPAKIPATVEKMDRPNDLAILRVKVDLSSEPLVLGDAVSPGSTVYAIGNPIGLEKSMSQGLVSALRNWKGRSLIQVTAPLSHGSSGGPILNDRGEVVGIAVGMIEEGQNLNFAIPVEVLRQLLTKKASSITQPIDLFIADLEAVAKERGKYSSEPDSSWQRGNEEIRHRLRKHAPDYWNDGAALLRVADSVRSTLFDVDEYLPLLQRSVQLLPNADTHRRIAEALHWKATLTKNEDLKPALLKEARHHGEVAMKAKAVRSTMYTLASIAEDQGQFPESERLLKSSLIGPNDSITSEADVVRALMRVQAAQSKIADEQASFSRLQRLNEAGEADWFIHAEYLENANLFSQAGDAYAAGTGQFFNLWCKAARQYWFANRQDDALAAARACIKRNNEKQDAQDDIFKAHHIIAVILNGRGVYTEAMNHAREGLALDDSDASLYSELSEALQGLHRNQEAVNAAKQAIKLSDGKHSYMHFVLGAAYFGLEDWTNARQSYEKAAELEPKDSAAAYNVAVCNQRLGYFTDAVRWYEEVLRRNPSHPDKDSIRQRITLLRQ
jgi:tetratricopeptide (TPR) repeat protein